MHAWASGLITDGEMTGWVLCTYWDQVEWPYYRSGLYREVKMLGYYWDPPDKTIVVSIIIM